MNHPLTGPQLAMAPALARDSASLKASAVSGLKWNYLGQGARAASSLAVGMVLARLLGPQPFGQVAIAMLVIGLGGQLADLGFGAALVQRKELTAREIRFGFSLQLMLGAALALLCAALAGGIAGLFHQPEVAPVIRVLAALFLLQALGQSAMSLLKRDLTFRSLQMAQLVSYLVGYAGVGIPLACCGFGVWALVWAQLCQAAVNTAMVYARTRHPVTPLLRGDGAMVGFGAKVIATNLLNWIIGNLNMAMAGRCFSASDLGLYNRSFVLAGTPVSSGVSALQSVLFSAYSRRQDRAGALPRVYLASLGVVGAVVFPAYAAMAVAPETVLLALFGAKWAGAAPLLTAFAVAMPLQAALAMAGPLLWGIARVECELRAQLVVALAAVAVFATAARLSLVALAWGVALVYALRFVLLTSAALRVLGLSWGKAAGALRGALSLAALVAAAVWSLDTLLTARGSAAAARLLVEIAAGSGLALGALLWAPQRLLGGDAILVLDSIRGCLPRFARPFLPRRPRPVSELGECLAATENHAG